MMRESEVDAAGVDIECFTKIFHGHGGTFDVPAGTARTDFCFPKVFAGLWRFPKSKVARAFLFVSVVVHTRAGLNTGQIDFGKISIPGKFRDAVVDRTFAVVRERFLLQAFDELHHFRNVVGSANPVFRRLNIQRLAIFEERICEFVRVFTDADFCRGSIGDDAVVHVGQIHDVGHLETAQLQKAAENVLKDERTEISDVRVVVNRGPAGIHFDFARGLRDEGLGLATERVVHSNFVHKTFVRSASNQTSG